MAIRLWKNYYKPENEEINIYLYKNKSEPIKCCIELWTNKDFISEIDYLYRERNFY